LATRYDNSVICLLVLLPLALLPVTDWGLALPKLYGILLGVALVYALVNSLATLRRAITATYIAVFVLGLGLSALGLIATALPTDKFLALGAIRGRLPFLAHGLVHGPTGGAINPDEMGGAVCLVLPFAVAALLAASSRRRARLWLVPALFLTTVGLAIVLLLTQSRSGYAGSAIGVFLVLVWWLILAQKSFLRRLFGSSIVLFLAILGVAVAWHAVQRGVGAIPLGARETLLQRFELWNRGLDMLQDFPFTGVGLAQFQPVMRALYPLFLSDPSANLPHVHDFFLQLALDIGIPGMVNIMFLFFFFFHTIFVSYRRHLDLETRALALGLGSGVIAFLTYGLTDAITLGAIGGMSLWAFLGLAAALSQPAARANTADGPSTTVPFTASHCAPGQPGPYVDPCRAARCP